MLRLVLHVHVYGIDEAQFSHNETLLLTAAGELNKNDNRMIA